MWWSNLSVSRKLLIGFGAVLFIVVWQAQRSYSAIDELHTRIGGVIDGAVAKDEVASEILIQAKECRALEVEFSSRRNPELLDRYATSFARLQAGIEQLRHSGGPDSQQDADRLRGLADALFISWNEMVTAQTELGFDQHSGLQGRFHRGAQRLREELDARSADDQAATAAVTTLLELERLETNYLLWQDENDAATVQQTCAALEKHIQQLSASPEESQALVKTVRTCRDAFLWIVEQSSVTQNRADKLAETTAAIVTVAHDVSTRSREARKSQLADISSFAQAQESTALLLGLIACAIGIGVSILIAYSLTRPLTIVLDRLRDVVEGERNLTKRIRLSSRSDEIGILSVRFDKFLDRMHELVRVLQTSVTDLDSAATELMGSAQQTQAGATEQAASIEESRRSLESLTVSAQHVLSVGQAVRERAEMSQAIAGQIGEKVADLSKHSERIDEILELIKEIANKSDLLALNAALEGTRAGESGRGFSLVATQMQRLAEQVMGSVKSISVLVNDIAEATNGCVLASEEAIKIAVDTTESAREIERAVAEQKAGTQESSVSMDQISAVTRDSLTATKAVVTAADRLNILSVGVRKLVDTYVVD